MVFNGLPEVFPDKVQNAELYMQKRIYDSLQFLTVLPVIQNESGLFSNYMAGNVEVGKPRYTNNGINFNEIKFDKGSTVAGQTLPIGFMYNANTRNKQRGTYESDLLSFYNESVTQLADFYEEKYAQMILTGGRQSNISLSPWDTAEHIIDNELDLEDEMRYDANDNRTGFKPNTAIVSRRTKLTIEKALRLEKYESNWDYIASNRLADGDFAIFDINNPGAAIHKFADPDYSIAQTLEDADITTTEEGEPLPKAFINVDIRSGRPQAEEHYVWAESNVHMRNSNGFLILRGSN